jgi:hypothetical protein
MFGVKSPDKTLQIAQESSRLVDMACYKLTD